MKQPYLSALAAFLLGANVFLAPAYVLAQSPGSSSSSVEPEEARWKASEERMLHVFQIALRLLQSPDTEAIRKGLEKSQPDWLKYRESHCALQATVYAYGRAYDEKNVQRCLAREADLRTRYIQSFVP